MILALLQQLVRLANARRDETWGIPLGFAQKRRKTDELLGR